MSSEQVQAIIPAGGIGKRMKNQQPKQFLTLDGQPILCITLRALAESKQISKFIVPSVDIVYTRRIIASYCPNIEVEVIKGGSTRQESVYNGLQTIINSGTEPNYVLVHDAVRALIRAETVKAVIDAAKKYGSATAANQVTDTLKLAYDENGQEFIRKNVSRDFMWAAQTPQVFRTQILINAYKQAIQDKFTGTDSTGLVERIGEKVALVDCPNSNIKITTPEDLLIAEQYLLQSMAQNSKDLDGVREQGLRA